MTPTPDKPRGHRQDVALDADGRVIAMGDEARAGLRAALADPDARVLLYVVETPSAMLIEVSGPPSERVAELLEHVAVSYRRASQVVTAQNN